MKTDGVDLEEPLLNGASVSDAGQSMVEYPAPSSTQESADEEIKDQIRDMQDNFLVRMSRTVDRVTPSTAGSLEPAGAAKTANTQQLQYEKAPLLRRMKRATSVISQGYNNFSLWKKPVKPKGTVALLFFHIILTALWAIIGACYYSWRLVSKNRKRTT